MKIDKWTVVQHSGYGYAGKEAFEHATETRKIESKTALKLVELAGGEVFDSYLAAENFADLVNYPAGYEGLAPNAQGTFSTKKIDGLAIYIPVREAVG